MLRWQIVIFAVMALTVVVGVGMGVEFLTAQSSDIILNVTVIPGGGGNVTSTTVFGNMHIGEGVSGFGTTGSDIDARFGFFSTTNKSLTLANVTGTNITVYAWNGTVWDSSFDVSFTTCTVGQAFCEPDDQNFSGGQGSLNITNTGSLNITQIDISLNHTCAFVNFTYSNSSNLSDVARLPLDATDRLLWSNLTINLSFEFFVWANFSLPTAPCAAPATNYEVT